MSEPMTLTARIAAPIEEVHRALTDPGHLRVWLAEHAEVELPHRFAFWGRHTPEGDEPRQRLLHVDDRTLRFAWTLGGEETTTEFTLRPEGDGTVLTLSQTGFDFQDTMTGKTVRGWLQTFWSLAIANLADHLEGRPLTSRVDFTSPELRETVDIAASPDEVYDSLINSEKFSQWFGYKIDIEPWVGGRVAMGGFDAPGEPAKVLELVPGRKMSTDWGAAGVTTWELEGSGGRTRLTMVQSGFDQSRPPYAAWMGWLSGIAELRRFHELPGWRPIWLGMELPDASAAC